MSVVTITKGNFEEEVLNSEGTVLIDFWAAWCAPCKMLSPVIDEVAEEVSGIKVGKVNIDEERELAMQFNVMSIPTLLVFKAGKETDRSVGVIPKEEIKALLGCE